MSLQPALFSKKSSNIRLNVTVRSTAPKGSYGFASLKDFIASAPNLYEIKCNSAGDVLYRAITNDSFCLYDSLMPIRRKHHDRRNKEYCFDYAPPTEIANSASSSSSSEGTIDKTETNVNNILQCTSATNANKASNRDHQK
ncbi:putative protease SohB [Trichinella spiralis]|uniref:Protease SohB n=1 Tax=Trichinella spiralis TaxID=6334 RepID=A0ABR3KBJ8_TRISP